MNFETITQATDTAVPLNIAKDHLRVSDNASDALISGAIQASTGFAENFLNRTLATKSYRLSLDDWAPRIFLKLPPLITVDSVKYDDENDVEQTLATSVYESGHINKLPFIQLAPDQSWPDLSTTTALERIRIDYTAGYGGASDIPDPIVQSMLLNIGDMYENRETQVIGQPINENPASINLLFPYRIQLGV